MAKEEPRDRHSDHNDWSQGEHRIVSNGRGLTGVLVVRPASRRLFHHRLPHRSGSLLRGVLLNDKGAQGARFLRTPETVDAFRGKEDGCIKVVLKPN